jgi:hypothetical protein
MIATLALATAIGTNLAAWHQDREHVEKSANIYVVFPVAEQSIILGTEGRNNLWFGWRGESDKIAISGFGIKAAVTLGARIDRVATYEEIVRDYEDYRRSILTNNPQPLRRARAMKMTGHKTVTEPVALLSLGAEVSKDWTIWTSVSESQSVYVSVEWRMK